MYQEWEEGTLEGTLPIMGILSIEGEQVEEEGTIQTRGLLLSKTNHPWICQLEEGEEEWTPPPQSTHPGCTPYLNPLRQLMEVQEQRQREEDSRREQDFQTMELAEMGLLTP